MGKAGTYTVIRDKFGTADAALAAWDTVRVLRGAAVSPAPRAEPLIVGVWPGPCSSGFSVIPFYGGGGATLTAGQGLGSLDLVVSGRVGGW